MYEETKNPSDRACNIRKMETMMGRRQGVTSKAIEIK